MNIDTERCIEKVLRVSDYHLRTEYMYEQLFSKWSKSNTDILLHIDSNEEYADDWENMSKELGELADICRENNCPWLMMDENARQISGIATYGWNEVNKKETICDKH